MVSYNSFTASHIATWKWARKEANNNLDVHITNIIRNPIHILVYTKGKLISEYLRCYSTIIFCRHVTLATPGVTYLTIESECEEHAKEEDRPQR